MHCVVAVKKALEEIDGVSNVKVDLAAGEASFEETKPVDDVTIKKQIEKAGYRVV